MPTPDKIKRVVWSRAAGRCIICNKDLLSAHLGSDTALRAIGEVAHIVAESPDGPRGDASGDPIDRNNPNNLVLLCPNEHTEADSGRLSDTQFTVDYLRKHKTAKEAWVRFVTGLDQERRTTIVRLSGDVRGATGLVSEGEAASVVMNETLRTPYYLPDPRGIGLTIDLSGFPDPGTPDYWHGCLRSIRHQTARLHASVKSGETTHVSVFGFALVPLLVALGYSLDDTIPAAIYDRQRSTESWAWNSSAPIHSFTYDLPDFDNHTEAIFSVSASGSISIGEIPGELANLPVIEVRLADGTTPGPTTLDSAKTLNQFRRTIRNFLAEMESHRSIRHLHMFLAAPVSVCVSLGSCWPKDNAAPDFTIYHRTKNQYEPAITLPSPDKEH